LPKVTTTVSFEHEEYGKGEVSSFSREVEDLDYHDWAWYVMKTTEVMGFDCAQVQFITSDGRICKTDL